MHEYEKDNVIEFLNTDEVATVTASREWLKNRLGKLAAEHPDECEIVHENDDGSILAHVPSRWVRISPPREISEEHRRVLRLNMQKYWAARKAGQDAVTVGKERLEE